MCSKHQHVAFRCAINRFPHTNELHRCVCSPGFHLIAEEVISSRQVVHDMQKLQKSITETTVTIETVGSCGFLRLPAKLYNHVIQPFTTWTHLFTSLFSSRCGGYLINNELQRS